MTQLHVEAEGQAHAPPAVIWALIADANSYCRWGPWTASGYQSPGDEAPDSAGTIRWMRYGRTTTIEKVLEVENGRRMAYTVVKGIPVRNYRAEVILTPTAAGTIIHWAADWDRTMAGRIVHRKLRSVYPDVVAHLVAAANRGMPAPNDTAATE
jgi:Polyketide cyclase / dehydrase and lipid transport